MHAYVYHVFFVCYYCYVFLLLLFFLFSLLLVIFAVVVLLFSCCCVSVVVVVVIFVMLFPVVVLFLNLFLLFTRFKHICSCSCYSCSCYCKIFLHARLGHLLVTTLPKDYVIDENGVFIYHVSPPTSPTDKISHRHSIHGNWGYPDDIEMSKGTDERELKKIRLRNMLLELLNSLLTDDKLEFDSKYVTTELTQHVVKPFSVGHKLAFLLPSPDTHDH